MGNLLPGISGDVLGRLRIFICQFFIVSAAASSHHPRAPVLHEQMDRDSLLPVPGARLFGFPPIYYQTTTDFSVASAIVVKGKETAQANLTVAGGDIIRSRDSSEECDCSRTDEFGGAPYGALASGLVARI